MIASLDSSAQALPCSSCALTFTTSTALARHTALDHTAAPDGLDLIVALSGQPQSSVGTSFRGTGSPGEAGARSELSFSSPELIPLYVHLCLILIGLTALAAHRPEVALSLLGAGLVTVAHLTARRARRRLCPLPPDRDRTACTPGSWT